MPGPPTDPEELLRYDGFLRALARDLTSNRQEAEDLAQDAWVAALDARSHGAQVHSWGGWLTGALQRLAVRGRRNAARRRSREQRAAPADALPSTAEIVAREEARRRVVEAVLALDEPARAVILLRYFENLPPREIARRLGLPVETVRTRARRALERLRAQLDERHGGRRAQWSAALLPWAKMPPALSPWDLALMPAKTKTLAATLLLVVLAFLLLRNWTGSDGAREPDSALIAVPPAAEVAARASESGQNDTPATAEIARAELPGSPDEPTDTAAARGRLTVRVLREQDGKPAPGQWLRVHCWGATNPYFNTLEGQTDAQGIAQFAVPAGEVLASLHRSAGDKALESASVKPDEETVIELILSRGITLEGEVVDLAGVPVAEAEIWLSDEGNLDGGHAVALSDQDGRFLVEAVGSGHWIGARKAGHGPAVMPMLIAAEGARLPLRLVLQGPGGALHGRVTDPNGAPVAGAAVKIGADEPQRGKLADGSSGFRMPGPRLTTDKDGRFAAEGLEPGSTPVQVRAERWGLWRGTADIPPGSAAQLDVQLAPGVRARGRVTEESGEPAARAWIGTGDYGFADFSARAAADGSFLLEGLPAGELELFAHAREDEGRASSAAFHARPGEEIVWNPVLRSGSELRVRVVDEHGEGRPGCNLQLKSQADYGTSHTDFRGTDQEGRACFTQCPDQIFELEVLPPGSSFFPVKQLRDLRAGGEEIEIRLERALDPSVRIRGRLLMPGGGPAGAAILIPSSGGGSAPILMPDPATGAFDLGPFPPGIWQLWVRHPEFPDHVFGPQPLALGETWDLGEMKLAAGGTLVAVFGRGTGTQGLVPCLSVLQGSRSDGRALEFADDVARSRPLAPGDYLLIWDGEGLSSGCAPFTISSGGETVLNLSLTAGLACPLVVVEAKASELRSLDLLVHDASGVLVYADALFRGWEPEFRHELRLAPGAYRVEVRAADGRRAEGPLQVGPAGAAAGELRLTLPAVD